MAVATSALLVGCGDDEKDPPPDPPGKVLARNVDASRGECAHGGTAVVAGLDRNRNDQLEDDEVQTRTVLCNVAPAEPSLQVVLRLVAEPAGANCAEGGTAVQSGRDKDRDGHLDDDEVEHTDYVCDAQLVTRMAPEPAGVHCAAGGLAFSIGRDRDNDGALADAEIEWTEYECSDVLTRDVTIRSTADATALAGIRVIDGDVAIDHLVGTEVELPLLQHINGSLTVHFNYLGETLESLKLPKLTSISGDFSIQRNTELAVLEATELRDIGGDLVIFSNSGLVELHGLPALQRVGKEVSIRHNPELERAALFPNAAEGSSAIGEQLEVSNNPRLTRLTVGVHRLQNVWIHSNDVLPTLTLDVGYAGIIDIAHNPQLVTLSVRVPFLDNLSASGNDALQELELHVSEIFGHVQLSFSSDGDALRSLTISEVYDRPRPVKIHGELSLFGGVARFASDSKVHVTGDCLIGGTNLTSLQAIERVDGRILLSTNPRLTSVSPFAVKGGIGIYRNPRLSSLAFLQPAPTQEGDVDIIENAALTNLGPIATGISHITGYLRLAGNPALATAPSFALRSVGARLEVNSNATLGSLRFPVLDRVDGDIEIIDNDALVDLQLPQLTKAVMVKALFNASFLQLHIPAVTQLSWLSIQSNPSFPSCSLSSTCSRVSGLTCSIFDNDEDDSCSP